MTYRKSNKNIKTKKYGQTIKKILIVVAVFFFAICLGAAFMGSALRVSTGIDGFEQYYSGVSTDTRKALKSELEQFVLLNTGNPKVKVPKFSLRQDEEILIETDEDGDSYSSFIIDSEELQLSARVQLSWAKQFSKAKTTFVVRIDCAEESKFEDSHCYSRSTGEMSKAIESENMGLLEAYGVSKAAIKKVQKDMLDYLKIIYPDAKSALILKRTITESGNMVYGTLVVDDKSFGLEISKSEEWSIKLSSGSNLIWSADTSKNTQANRHYSILEKQLPIEVATKNNSRFLLHFLDKKHLSIDSASCEKEDKNADLEKAAKEWLEANGYDSKAFEIKLKKACES